MTKSDSIAQLAEALSKAQAEMTGAKKDSANPFFKSSYADLASVWDACREPLGKYGLSVSQMPEVHENQVVVHTILMHSSGEWIASSLAMTPVKNDPQGMGSAITYARRYALSAAVGIAPEDDDGNAASNKGVARTTEAIPIPKVAAPAIKQAAVPKAIEGGGLQQAATVTEQLKASLEAMQQRQPGDDTEECIDRGQQVNLAKEFRDALPSTRKKESESLRHVWLAQNGYLDSEGNPSSQVIPAAAWPKCRDEAVAYAKGLPA